MFCGFGFLIAFWFVFFIILQMIWIETLNQFPNENGVDFVQIGIEESLLRWVFSFLFPPSFFCFLGAILMDCLQLYIDHQSSSTDYLYKTFGCIFLHRYYYAMVECDSSATTDYLYKTVMELNLKVLEKWLGVNEKLPAKSGPSKPMWVRPSPSNLYIY